jgi:hypothetical protein
MASHANTKVRKTAPRTWAIQVQTPDGYRTIGKSNSRMKANMSAGIASSNIDQGKRP